MSKARREIHKRLVERQQFNKEMSRTAFKYGYKERSRRKQITKAVHDETMSFKKHHQMEYAWQNIARLTHEMGEKIAKNFEKSMKAHGVKI